MRKETRHGPTDVLSPAEAADRSSESRGDATPEGWTVMDLGPPLAEVVAAVLGLVALLWTLALLPTAFTAVRRSVRAARIAQR